METSLLPPRAAPAPSLDAMRPDSRTGPGTPRRIVNFHQDAEGHWVADLECGHTQHVRHQPPWQNRQWVVTEEGRASFLGRALDCIACPPA
jgi:hypothetical protein